GRRELHFVCAADDDAVAETHAAFKTDLIAIARGDFYVSPGEPLAADLREDVRSTCFEQDRCFGDRLRVPAVPKAAILLEAGRQSSNRSRPRRACGRLEAEGRRSGRAPQAR